MTTFGVRPLHNVESWYAKNRLQFEPEVIRTIFNSEISCIESTDKSVYVGTTTGTIFKYKPNSYHEYKESLKFQTNSKKPITWIKVDEKSKILFFQTSDKIRFLDTNKFKSEFLDINTYGDDNYDTLIHKEGQFLGEFTMLSLDNITVTKPECRFALFNSKRSEILICEYTSKSFKILTRIITEGTTKYLYFLDNFVIYFYNKKYVVVNTDTNEKIKNEFIESKSKKCSMLYVSRVNRRLNSHVIYYLSDENLEPSYLDDNQKKITPYIPNKDVHINGKYSDIKFSAEPIEIAISFPFIAGLIKKKKDKFIIEFKNVFNERSTNPKVRDTFKSTRDPFSIEIQDSNVHLSANETSFYYTTIDKIYEIMLPTGEEMGKILQIDKLMKQSQKVLQLKMIDDDFNLDTDNTFISDGRKTLKESLDGISALLSKTENAPNSVGDAKSYLKNKSNVSSMEIKIWRTKNLKTLEKYNRIKKLMEQVTDPGELDIHFEGKIEDEDEDETEEYSEEGIKETQEEKSQKSKFSFMRLFNKRFSGKKSLISSKLSELDDSDVDSLKFHLVLPPSSNSPPPQTPTPTPLPSTPEPKRLTSKKFKVNENNIGVTIASFKAVETGELSVPKGEYILILSNEAGWSKIRYDDKEGFIPTSYHNKINLEALQKRIQIVKEFIIAEEEYIQNLNLLIKHFVQPSKDYISKEAHDTLFSNINTIIGVNMLFLNKIKQIAQKSRHVIDIELIKLLNEFSEVFKLYGSYINEYQNSSTLQRAIEKNPKFENFLKTKKEELNNLNTTGDILDYLILPIERIDSYQKFTENLMKNTIIEESHKRYDQLKRSHTKITKVVNYISDRRIEAETRYHVWEIQKKYNLKFNSQQDIICEFKNANEIDLYFDDWKMPAFHHLIIFDNLMIIDVPKIEKWDLMKFELNDDTDLSTMSIYSNSFTVSVKNKKHKIRFNFKDNELCVWTREKIEEILIGSYE
eukprot:gene2500-3206_t